MITFQLNWLAILGAAVLSMIVGFVWYSMPLFGKTWMKLTGLKESDLNSSSPVQYLFTFLGSFAVAFVLANIVKTFAVSSLFQGFLIGFIISLLPFFALMATFLFEHRSWKLLMVDGLYHVVWLTFAGGLLAIWV